MSPALESWSGDHGMTKNTTKAAAVADDILLFDDWFDAMEKCQRNHLTAFVR
jgi:hypothetical protein